MKNSRYKVRYITGPVLYQNTTRYPINWANLSKNQKISDLPNLRVRIRT